MANSHLFNVRSALRKATYGYDDTRTPRKPNWSEIECEFLLQEIQKNITIIRSRKPDGCGSRKTNKADMWYKMSIGLHSRRPAVTRSVRDLKDKWKKLQFMAKQQVARARANASTRRTPDGLIEIPKLVYKVMEARGQDPGKLGFCFIAAQGNLNNSSHGSNQQVYVPVEQDASNVELGGEIIKEEDTNDQAESPFSIQIQNAVSLAPGYNQTDQEMIHVPIVTSVASTSSMLAVPVSLEKAGSSVSQADHGSSTFSSRQVIQNKPPKIMASHNNFRMYNQRTARPVKSTNRQRSFNNDLGNNSNRRINCNNTGLDQQLHIEDNTQVTNSHQLNNSFASLSDIQNDRSLENNTFHVSHTSCPSTIATQSEEPSASYQNSVGESSQMPHQRICPKGLMGHICDDQVIELQREVLREERNKICLEKELLKMQREKVKLELILLRQKINEHHQ